MEIKEILTKVTDGLNISYEEAYETMNKIMKGELDESQVACYLTSLKMKGETVDEISASAQAMRDNAVHLNGEENSLDIVGTGGDKAFTFNISSISALIISSNGIKVAKHGNRSVSSKCGAADVFEQLGVNINTDPEKAKEILDKIGLCFLFAQKYHLSMKNVGGVRKKLGIRTIFNILGPLTNPANAKNILLGVYDKNLVLPIANVLKKLGIKNALVAYGLDGLDEITLTDKTYIAELRNDKIIDYYFNPEDYGFTLCKKEDLVGGLPEINKTIAFEILNGAKGPKRDIVVINSALGIYIASEGLSIKDCIKMAETSIDNKNAFNQLKKYIEISNQL